MKTLKFFLLVFALSIPFWILGALADDITKFLPIKLPISSLMAFCPLLAAIILVYKEGKTQDQRLSYANPHNLCTRAKFYQLECLNLSLKTSHSLIKGGFSFNYTSWDDYTDFINE